MSGTGIIPQPGGGWDEAQCTAALAQLEQLQAQINDLRLAIPRIVEPFHQPFTSTTFKMYAQGAMSSQNGIKALNEHWKSRENQATFEHVRTSFATNPDLSASALTPSHGWREREHDKTNLVLQGHGESIEEAGITLRDEDVSRIIVEFQKKHPGIKLETEEDHHTILIRLMSGSTRLEFRIVIERHADGRHKLLTSCLGLREPFQTVTRCVASRARVNDLEYLLDMIAAYNTVKSTSCAKCARSLDSTMSLPIARRSKQAEIADGTFETVWEAFHEGCIG
ncbi:hypothetical protein NX059_006103 [Plenodomus lindquistii]|nr:hypothetical protein NX059_006103 [Plenodomus lindquistii]